MYADLRIDCAKRLTEMNFPGYALGGLSVGEPKELLYEMIEATEPYLPQNKPRYLMGVGSLDCLLEGTLRGIDMFDCVMQTRMARNGAAFSKGKRIHLRNAKYSEDFCRLIKNVIVMCANIIRERICDTWSKQMKCWHPCSFLIIIFIIPFA